MVSANLDAPRLAGLVLALDFATFVVAGAVLRAFDLDRPFWDHPWRHGAEAALPIAVFLASADSGWLTGETLLASGGLR